MIKLFIMFNRTYRPKGDIFMMYFDDEIEMKIFIDKLDTVSREPFKYEWVGKKENE